MPPDLIISGLTALTDILLKTQQDHHEIIELINYLQHCLQEISCHDLLSMVGKVLTNYYHSVLRIK